MMLAIILIGLTLEEIISYHSVLEVAYNRTYNRYDRLIQFIWRIGNIQKLKGIGKYHCCHFDGNLSPYNYRKQVKYGGTINFNWIRIIDRIYSSDNNPFMPKNSGSVWSLSIGTTRNFVFDISKNYIFGRI